MYIKIILISVACLSQLMPAHGTSLLAAAAAAGTIKGAILGAGIKGLLSSGSETVIVNAEPGSMVETVPAQSVIYQPQQYQPVQYTPVQQMAVPVVVRPTSMFDRVCGIWNSITSAIAAKARAVGSIFSALKPPQQVIVLLPNNTTTTTTTTTTTKKPVTVQVIVQDKVERLAPIAVLPFL